TARSRRRRCTATSTAAVSAASTTARTRAHDGGAGVQRPPPRSPQIRTITNWISGLGTKSTGLPLPPSPAPRIVTRNEPSGLRIALAPAASPEYGVTIATLAWLPVNATSYWSELGTLRIEILPPVQFQRYPNSVGS